MKGIDSAVLLYETGRFCRRIKITFVKRMDEITCSGFKEFLHRPSFACDGFDYNQKA
jgi:hypothetical protein